MISTGTYCSLLDIIETTGPYRYIVQAKFALVSNGLEFSALKIIVYS